MLRTLYPFRFLLISVAGQAARGIQETLVSSEVRAERTVTFPLYAPKATEVTITGDWMATLESRTGGIAKMTKGADGVWTFTSPPLEPTIHLYFFTLDGLNIADPVNPVIKLRNRTSGSLVEVPGNPAPVWQLQQVPRGTVDFNKAAARCPELASAKAAEGKLDLIWISYGNQDPNHTGAEAFDAALTKNGVKHTYVTRDGGHVWPVWRWSIAEFSPLLFRKKELIFPA